MRIKTKQYEIDIEPMSIEDEFENAADYIYVTITHNEDRVTRTYEGRLFEVRRNKREDDSQ